MTEPIYGRLKKDGQLLHYDGVSRYIFADYSPFPGLNFVLSSDLEEDDQAFLYVSPGSEVFELKLLEADDWKVAGGALPITTELVDDDTVDIYIRANPSSKTYFPTDGPTEGLLQICGEEERSISLFSYATMSYGLTVTTAYRLIIPTFAAQGVQVRFKFYAHAAYPISLESVYFGKRDTGVSFLANDKIQILFDDGSTTHTGTTSAWSDWATYEYNGDYEHLIGFMGAVGRDATATNFSYHSLYEGDASSDTGMIYKDADGVEEAATVGLAGISDMEIMTVDHHITSIPLSAVVSNQLPSMTVHATIIDTTTAEILENFGITAGVLAS